MPRENKIPQPYFVCVTSDLSVHNKSKAQLTNAEIMGTVYIRKYRASCYSQARLLATKLNAVPSNIRQNLVSFYVSNIHDTATHYELLKRLNYHDYETK